jgi:hypothetical protein
MNYAKVVGAALQLFPKKINVTVINEVTGASVGNFKMALSQLPETFDKPTILEVEGHAWRVVKANPVKADDFSISKKLMLHVLEKPQWTDERLLFNVPTRHAYHPLMTHTPLFNDLILDVDEDKWRQIEFLPAGSLLQVQEEMKSIEAILVPGSLWGYNTCHVREQTANFPLQIPLADFCHLVQAQKTGAVRMYGNAFVESGITIESANYTYYGTISEDTIVSLCLPVFDGIDDEFMQLVTTYNLVLVNWCETKVVMIDLAGGQEQVDMAGTPDASFI